MRVVVAGGGSVGTAISLDLLDRHHDVTLLEHVSATAEKLPLSESPLPKSPPDWLNESAKLPWVG